VIQTIDAIFLSLIFMSGSVIAQTVNDPSAQNQKLKTIRLHIDGFSKSKSGAV
jgi:hypothetical protein